MLNNKIIVEESNKLEIIRRMAIDTGAEAWELKNVDHAWIAELNGEIIGGVILLKFGRDCAIEWLSVKEKFRGQSIGTELTDKAIDWAKGKYERIVISMQIPDFFQRFGFLQVPMEDIPKDFSCLGCKRYNKDCFPIAMMLKLK